MYNGSQKILFHLQLLSSFFIEVLIVLFHSFTFQVSLSLYGVEINYGTKEASNAQFFVDNILPFEQDNPLL